MTTLLSQVETLLPTIGPARYFLDLAFGIEGLEDPAKIGKFDEGLRQLLTKTRSTETLLEKTLVPKQRNSEITATLRFLHNVRFLLEKRQFELRRDGSGHVRKIKTGFTRRGYLAKFAAALWNCANEKHVRASDFDYEIDVARQEHHRWQTPPPKRH